MKYLKPWLSLDDQVSQLLGRGMQGDRSVMRECLASVGYYRLSGYWYPFRDPGALDDCFLPGTSFDVVWDRYVFDRKLRLLVMDAVERIEIAVRANFALHHGRAFGAFGYADDPRSLPQLRAHEHAQLRNRIREEAKRARKETFVDHFNRKYGNAHQDLPVWMATEIMSFGTIEKLVDSSPSTIKSGVAKQFGVHPTVLKSWMLALNVLRNICAHHSRLWNRVLGVKPKIPHAHEWHTPVPIGNSRVFGLLTICRHGLRQIAPETSLTERLRELLSDHPRIPLIDMGFPPNWLDSPLWRQK